MSKINDILINNNYYIVDNICKDEFHIAIYYLTDNKCKIIIRRLDCNNWGQDLKITISGIENNESEKISLGSSEQNLKIIEIYTKIKLFKTIYEDQIIPKSIIQTTNYDMNLNIHHYNSIMSFVELNPEYSYKTFNDDECRLFIKNNLKDEYIIVDEVLQAFDLLIPGPLRADLFRYCYLYMNGGCYFDCKTILKKPLNKIIKKDDRILFSHDDNNNNSHNNGIILIEKNNEYMLNCIKNSVSNILNKNKGHTPFFTTGNEVFYEAFASTVPAFKKIHNRIFFNKDCNLNDSNCLFNSYYKNYYNNYLGTGNDFRIMWKHDKYFYKESKLILNYKFYFIPDVFDDEFEIFLLKDSICMVKRVDTNEGWGANLKIKVVDNDNNKVYYIAIGNSEENEKIFVIE